MCQPAAQAQGPARTQVTPAPATRGTMAPARANVTPAPTLKERERPGTFQLSWQVVLASAFKMAQGTAALIP